MTLEPQWFYIAITTPFVCAWALGCVFRPATRHVQLKMSALFAVVGVAVENIFYFSDYWHPPAVFRIDLGPVFIYPEFLLFGAAFGGLAAVLYPALCRMTIDTRRAPGAYMRLGILAVAFVISSVGLWVFGVNSILATACGAFVIAALMIYQRPDLYVPALLSSVFTVAIMFILYSGVVVFMSNFEDILKTVWYLYGTALDVRLGLVPLTELVWGAAVGSAIGIFYPYVTGARYRGV